MDGSYGFSDRMDTDDDNTKGGNSNSTRGGLYSDSMISRGRGRANNRDRGRGTDRGRGARQ